MLAVIAGFLWTKSHYYNLGEKTERAVWEQRIEDERIRNEELTKLLANSVETFGRVIETRNEERTSTETIRETRISTIVEEKPVYTECKVDQEVLDEQNAIKALGPKP